MWMAFTDGHFSSKCEIEMDLAIWRARTFSFSSVLQHRSPSICLSVSILTRRQQGNEENEKAWQQSAKTR